MDILINYRIWFPVWSSRNLLWTWRLGLRFLVYYHFVCLWQLIELSDLEDVVRHSKWILRLNEKHSYCKPFYSKTIQTLSVDTLHKKIQLLLEYLNTCEYICVSQGLLEPLGSAKRLQMTLATPLMTCWGMLFPIQIQQVQAVWPPAVPVLLWIPQQIYQFIRLVLKNPSSMRTMNTVSKMNVKTLNSWALLSRPNFKSFNWQKSHPRNLLLMRSQRLKWTTQKGRLLSNELIAVQWIARLAEAAQTASDEKGCH